jgi:UDP-glucose 4-epimerase/UDP-glucuronate decarboxylase
MAERVLITGGAGFVGLHLARYLLRHGSEVTLLDDFSRGRADRELDELRAHAQVVTHDLTHPIPDALLRGTFDSVYHLAGIVGVQRVQADPSGVLNVNLRAALNLLDWCRRTSPGTVFFSSTSEVADGAARLGLSAFPTPEDLPFVLARPRAPRATYALSKLCAEVLFWHQEPGLRVRIGRYHNVYGPRMGDDHVIPQFIARGLARHDPFAVYGAAQSRAFCYVDDAVAATVAMTRLDTDRPVVANIGDDSAEIRIGLLAERVVALCGYRPVLRELDPPPGSPERRLPDLSVLRDEIGYRPRTSLEAGLQATYEWYAARAAVSAG